MGWLHAAALQFRCRETVSEGVGRDSHLPWGVGSGATRAWGGNVPWVQGKAAAHWCSAGAWCSAHSAVVLILEGQFTDCDELCFTTTMNRFDSVWFQTCKLWILQQVGVHTCTHKLGRSLRASLKCWWHRQGRREVLVLLFCCNELSPLVFPVSDIAWTQHSGLSRWKDHLPRPPGSTFPAHPRIPQAVCVPRARCWLMSRTPRALPAKLFPLPTTLLVQLFSIHTIQDNKDLHLLYLQRYYQGRCSPKANKTENKNHQELNILKDQTRFVLGFGVFYAFDEAQ